METFFGFLKVVVICISAVVVLFLVLLALPKSPVRDFVFSLTKRLGATAAGAIIFLPIDIVPVAGEIGDLLIAGFLIWYWYGFFKERFASVAAESTQRTVRSGEVRTIEATIVDDEWGSEQ